MASMRRPSIQIDLAAFGLRLPEGLQVRVLRVENILDNHRIGGKLENHSGARRKVPAGVLLNLGYPMRVAAGKKA